MGVIRNSNNNFGALSGAAFAQYDPVKMTTRGDLEELTVIKTAADTDKPVGVAKWAATAAGQEVTVFGPGDKCLLRVGSGGCTAGNYGKLANGDPLEVVEYTPGVTTAVFCVCRFLETRSENEYSEVELILAPDAST
jgi:hypothetical protein